LEEKQLFIPCKMYYTEQNKCIKVKENKGWPI
jgi:hypothetical protein